MKTIIAIILGFTSVGLADNSCFCKPTTEKKYFGEARQKSTFGFTIHWSCEYKCSAESGQVETVYGTYKKFYAKSVKSENGSEGICEGMTYKPQFNASRNYEVYVWDGNLRYFNPSRSSSKDLRDWADEQGCE